MYSIVQVGISLATQTIIQEILEILIDSLLLFHFNLSCQLSTINLNEDS